MDLGASSAGDDTFKPCGKNQKVEATQGAVAKSTSEFNRAGHLLSDGIGVFASAEAARVGLATFRRFFGACSHWTQTDKDGTKTTIDIKPLAIAAVGDDTAAYEMTGSIEGGSGGFTLTTTLAAQIAAVRRKNVIDGLAQLSIGIFGSKASVDIADTNAALRAIDAKLLKLATVTGPLPSASPGPSSSASPTPLNSPANSSENSRAAVGQPLTLNGSEGVKVAVTVVRVVDPAPPTEFSQPQSGSRFVAVQLQLANVGTVNYDDSPGNGAKIVDTTNQQYEEGSGETTAGPGFGGSVRLSPEDVRVGFVVFELPSNARPRLFQFVLDSGFAAQTGEWTLAAQT
jgi:hypothetical protein